MGYLTSDVILDNALERYEAQSTIMLLADGRYDSQWGDKETKGDAISIRLPVYARARRGEEADPQAMDERLVTLRIPEAFGSDSFITDRQLAMELNDFKEQVLEPHIDAVTAAISKEALKIMVEQVSNFVGTPGVIPTSYDTYQDAHRLLTQGGTPQGFGQRNLLVNAAMDQQAVKAGRLLYNAQEVISMQMHSGTMVAAGNVGYVGGATWYEEEALYQHTVGALGAAGTTPRVNGANQVGNSIITDGWNVSVTGLLKKNDKLQFGGSFMVHPVLGSVYTDLTPFTVAADVNSDGGGNATITLTEPVEFGTPYANVSAPLADNALISVWGQAAGAAQAAISGITFTLGVMFQKSALVFASPDLILPSDVDKMSGRTRSKQMKIGMRIWRASDVNKGRVITRLDTLCGHLVGQNRKAVLVCSQ